MPLLKIIHFFIRLISAFLYTIFLLLSYLLFLFFFHLICPVVCYCFNRCTTGHFKKSWKSSGLQESKKEKKAIKCIFIVYIIIIIYPCLKPATFYILRKYYNCAIVKYFIVILYYCRTFVSVKGNSGSQFNSSITMGIMGYCL